MRLSEIAAYLSKLTGRDEAKIHIALRSPAMKSLFRREPGPTPKSPDDYAPIELVRARLLLAGQSCGLTVTELGHVSDALNKAITPKQGGRVPSHLEELVSARDWVIRVRYTEDAEGERHAFVAIGPESELLARTDDERRAHEALNALDHTTDVGHLIIPASDLIAPLLPLLAEG
ncbi:hypothetical protein [Pontibaca methylaminivorans]|uniref:hypothetical protein n=1 Tax=Pontibaca methylaminivorans TaxID=515897 RepID=UPI002FDA4A05